MPTPMPATIRAVRPTRVRNWPSRSMKRRVPGAPSVRSCTCQPAAPKRFLSLSRHRLGIGAGGELQPIGAGVEAARLDEAGGGEAGAVDERGRAEGEALPDPVRLLGDEADDFAARRRRSGCARRPGRPAARPARARSPPARRPAAAASARPQPKRPEERPGLVDALQLDEHALLAVEPRRHGAHPGDVAEPALARESRQLAAPSPRAGRR